MCTLLGGLIASLYYLHKFKLIWGILGLLLHGFAPLYLGDFCKYRSLLLQPQQRLAVILPSYYDESIQKPVTQEEREKLAKKKYAQNAWTVTADCGGRELANNWLMYTQCAVESRQTKSME